MMSNGVALYVSKMWAKALVEHEARKSPVPTHRECLLSRHLGFVRVGKNGPRLIIFDPLRGCL